MEGERPRNVRLLCVGFGGVVECGESGVERREVGLDEGEGG